MSKVADTSQYDGVATVKFSRKVAIQKLTGVDKETQSINVQRLIICLYVFCNTVQGKKKKTISVIGNSSTCISKIP